MADPLILGPLALPLSAQCADAVGEFMGSAAAMGYAVVRLERSAPHDDVSVLAVKPAETRCEGCQREEASTRLRIVTSPSRAQRVRWCNGCSEAAHGDHWGTTVRLASGEPQPYDVRRNYYTQGQYDFDTAPEATTNE